MKRIQFMIALAISFQAVVLSAAEQTLTFEWQKPIVEPDLHAFELQYSRDAYWENYLEDQNPTSGTWTPFVTVPFVIKQAIYQHTTPITVPDSQEHTYFFRVRALDKSGNASDWNYGTTQKSCYALIDFKAPGVTIELTVIIQPGE